MFLIYYIANLNFPFSRSREIPYPNLLTLTIHCLTPLALATPGIYGLQGVCVHCKTEVWSRPSEKTLIREVCGTLMASTTASAASKVSVYSL